MKKSLLIVFLTTLVLAGCVSKSVSDKPTVVKMTAEQIFQKKKECSLLSEDMLKYAQEFRSQVYEIDEIFYSPKLNSCLFIADAWKEQLLFDFFGRQNLDICSNGIYCTDYDSKIKELKWE